MCGRAKELIHHDTEVMRKIANLKRFEFSAPNSYTWEWYQQERLAREDHENQIRDQLAELEAQRIDVFHHIRTLPEDDARYLLEAYLYKCDGDQGYGDWPE